MKQSIILILLLGFMSNAISETLNVHWIGSKGYRKAIKNAHVTPQKANVILAHVYEKHGMVPSEYGNINGNTSWIFIGENYMFQDLIPKAKVHLGGFYINIHTCVVEYRRTEDKVYQKKGVFSNNNEFSVTYTSTETFVPDLDCSKI